MFPGIIDIVIRSIHGMLIVNQFLKHRCGFHCLLKALFHLY